MCMSMNNLEHSISVDSSTEDPNEQIWVHVNRVNRHREPADSVDHAVRRIAPA